MKKLLALFLAVAMLLSLAACGKEAAKPDTAPTESAATEATEAAPDPWTHAFTQYGNVTIKIVGAEFTQNDWGDDILRIYYDYTNTDDSARGHYPYTVLEFLSIKQDGKDCETYSFRDSDENAVPEDQNHSLYIQPNCTNRNTIGIKCDPNGGVVDISCYVMVGSWMYNPEDIQPFNFQIDPKNMLGAPEAFTLPAITNPTYTAGMSASGPYDYPLDCEISIDSFELTKDYDGNDVLRVNLTVTNNGDEALPPSLIIGAEVYQDGVSLPWVSTWDMDEVTEEDEAYGEDLYPGETVKCSALFYPRNENPVEVVIESSNSDMCLGTSFDLAEAFAAARAAESVAADAAAAADKAVMAQLVGAWDRTNSWPDHLYFNAGNTGIHDMTGDKFPFTYYVSDGVLYLIYDDGDETDYEVSVSGNDMVLTNVFYDEEQTFVRADATAPTDGATEPTEAATEPTVDLSDALIGTWVDANNTETYAFNADGTGYQIYAGTTYGFNYQITDNHVNIQYDDGDTDHFDISIEGDTLTIANNWTYTRQ